MSELILNDSGYTHLGTFRVESGEIRVTDPCYCPTPRPGYGGGSLSHGDGILRVPALNGVWHLRARIIDDGMWGRLVAELQAFHESLIGHSIPRGDRAGGLFVDSGQMGVFDDLSFPREPEQFEYDDEGSFYKRACNLTWSDDDEKCRYGGCLTFGGVTSTGYGDGSYPSWTYTDGTGTTVAVTVEFIGDEEEEEDGDFYDGDDDGEEDDEDDDPDDDDEDEDEPDEN